MVSDKKYAHWRSDTTKFYASYVVLTAISSEVWRRVVLWYDTDVLDVHATSIFWNVGILPQHHTVSHPEDVNLILCVSCK
jgi:hypothetical protein